MSDSYRDLKVGFIGMRTLKTVLSVFICFLIAYFRDASPFYSAIAAVISMKEDHLTGLNEGKTRMKGTIIGGLFGLICLLFLEFIGIDKNRLILEYFVFSLFLIPIIYSNLKIKSSSSVSLSCIVFLSIVASEKTASPFVRVFDRTLETFIGIIVSVVVNLIL